MTSQIADFEELQELKKQFSLLDQKLEKQRILNEELLKESMRQKLSSIERWYRNRFMILYITIPVLNVVFLFSNLAVHWGFILLMDIIAVIEYIWYKKAYHILDSQNLPNLSMIKATENVMKHKQCYHTFNKIMILPYIVLIGWTILIACNYTLNLPKIALVVCLIIGSITWGIQQMKANNQKIEEVLKQIKNNE